MRSFTVPIFVDANKVNAEFKDGALRVTLAKREESLDDASGLTTLSANPKLSDDCGIFR